MQTSTLPQAVINLRDQYAQQAAQPVTDSERDALGGLLFELVKLLMQDGFTEGQRTELAFQYGVKQERALDIEHFLSSWGLDDE